MAGSLFAAMSMQVSCDGCLLHMLCLQVAAVDEPKLHMWETGIMRITRHPQMVGQGLW